MCRTHSAGPMAQGLLLQAQGDGSGCFAMPNIPISCASVSLFSFRYVHAVHRYTTWHIVRTGLAPTPGSRAVGSSSGLALVQFSGTTAPPTGGKEHTRERCRSSRCHRTDVREKQCFFSKAYRSYLKGPVLLYLKYLIEGPKSK